MDYTQNTQQEQQQKIDIRKYLFLVMSQWYLFVIALIISLSVVYLKNQYVQPNYGTHTTIIIKDANQPDKYLPSMTIFKQSTNIQNEKDILQQNYLTKVAATELHFDISYYRVERFISPEIYHKSPFVVNLDTTQNNAINVAVYVIILSHKQYQLENEEYNLRKVLDFGQQYVDAHFNFNITLADNNNFDNDWTTRRYFFRLNDLDAITADYVDRLKIEQPQTTGSMLWLWLSGPTPYKDADFLNKLIDVYVRTGLEEKNQVAVNTIKFIDSQLATVVDSLQNSSDDILNFRMQNNVIDLTKEGDAYFDRLKELETKKSLKKMTVKYFEYLLNSLTKVDDFRDILSPSVMGVDDPMITTYLSKLNDLYEQKRFAIFNTKSANKNIKNPAIVKLDTKIRFTIEEFKKAVETNIKVVNMGMKDIDSTENEINKRINVLPVNERLLTTFRRKYTFNDNVYTFLLQKRMEAGISQASNNSDTKILDKARGDRATSMPSNETSYTAGLIIALLLPLIFIILKEYMNDKIQDKSDIEKITNIPIIAIIGHNYKKTQFPVVDFPKSMIAEAFRSARTNLQYTLIDKPHQVISVNSTISGEGKTFCSANLAAIIAMSNKKTCLVGLDLRKPRVHKMFDYTNEIGVSTYLINVHNIDEIILPTTIPNLFLITSGPIPPNPAELLETDKMRELIEQLKERFDVIVFDTPPLAVVSDTLLITKFTEVNLFVLRQNYSNKFFLKQLDDYYVNKKIKNISLIVNDIRAGNSYGYKYGYRYNYGYGYSYSYNYKQSAGYYDDEKIILQNMSFWDKLMMRINNKKTPTENS